MGSTHVIFQFLHQPLPRRTHLFFSKVAASLFVGAFCLLLPEFCPLHGPQALPIIPNPVPSPLRCKTSQFSRDWGGSWESGLPALKLGKVQAALNELVILNSSLLTAVALEEGILPFRKWKLTGFSRTQHSWCQHPPHPSPCSFLPTPTGLGHFWQNK